MILLAKVALGFGTTLAVAGAYTFREGVIRVDVDEFRQGGSHVHMWVPAAAVPMALRLVPKHHLHCASFQAREAMPVVRAMFHELRNYPNTVFVEVTDGDQHVRVMVEVPARLSRAQREKLDEFAAIPHDDSYPQRKSFLDKAKRFFGGK